MRLTFSILVFNFFGQSKLDVTGSANIIGNLKLLNGNGNTFKGNQSGESNTEGYGNSFFGLKVRRSNTTGYVNNYFGAGARRVNTSGNSDCFFGDQAGSQNSIGLIRSGIGYSANSLGINYSNSTGIGHLADSTAVNHLKIGNSSVTSVSGQVPFATTSNVRFKTQISRENVSGIAFIKKLSQVTYYFDIRKFEERCSMICSINGTSDNVFEYSLLIRYKS